MARRLIKTSIKYFPSSGKFASVDYFDDGAAVGREATPKEIKSYKQGCAIMIGEKGDLANAVSDS
jgi:hypothetical protein